jgi:hypothetical protein
MCVELKLSLKSDNSEDKHFVLIYCIGSQDFPQFFGEKTDSRAQ